MPYLQTGKLVREKPTGKGKHGLLRWFSVKNLSANTRDAGSIPELGRSPGEGNGNLLQCSCLGIPWTEEPMNSRLHSMRLQRSDMIYRLNNKGKHTVMVGNHSQI